MYFCKGNHFKDQCQRFMTVDERRSVLRGCCYICPGKELTAANCHSTRPCVHCKQIRRHNRCLCPVKFHRTTEASAVSADDMYGDSKDKYQESEQCTTNSADVSVSATGDRVLLQTAMVEVRNIKTSAHRTTRVLLDCASNRSYISSELAQKLQLEAQGFESISVVTFGSEKPKTIQTACAQLEIMLKDGTTRKIEVNIVPKITGSISRSSIQLSESKFLLNKLPLADVFPQRTESSPIDFLIGNGYYLEFVTGEKMEVGKGLFLLGSKFGWLLTGRIENQRNKDIDCSMFISSQMNHNSISQVSRFSSLDESLALKPSFQDYWKLESIGITDDPEVNDDDKAISQFNCSVQLSEGRYYVSWPWKDNATDLPENYQLALGRFISLMKKLKQNEELFQKYSEIIKDQENKGIIEQVTNNSDPASIKHYIPHHAVATPTKTTTKVRIVYDASAKLHKRANSLNECLLRGPIILEDLCGLLLRFRTFPIGIIADIEKAFLQIGLHVKDRDVTRFFWLKDPKRASSSDNNLQIYRFCRVPFGAISSPFLLSATVKHHLKKQKSTIADKISDNIYVDNMVTGLDSAEEALKFYKQSKTIFNQASMNLREWTSNNKEFNSNLAEKDNVKSSSSTVLGLEWNTLKDCLNVKSNSTLKIQSASTKRQLFQSLASVFDPLGFFVPITVRGKRFIHQLWTQSLGWDDPVDASHLKEWKEIAGDLETISNQAISRFIGPPERKKVASIQLICFCDASSQAYATAVYSRIATKQGYVTNLLFAKSRLTPSKSMTIPRMELLAVVIGVRCLSFVEKQLRLPVSNKILWTDSQCVLHWITSQKPLPVFVENRLKEIRKHRDIDFRYVATQDNPADCATRGKYTYFQLKTSIWWTGPAWLLSEESCWPYWSYDNNSLSNYEIKNIIPKEIILVADSMDKHPPFNIDIDRYSSLIRLYRVTAWIQRFIDNTRNTTKRLSDLSMNELRLSRNKWISYIQCSAFPEIFNAITQHQRCNIKEQLNINKDEDDILRCHGRFCNADLPEAQRNPILLPKESNFTYLVVQHIHKGLLHSGVSHTLSQLRLEYWIPQGRSIVRRILSHCLICRKHGGGPYKVPDMPPWPSSRVSRTQPFSYSGIDYLGPLYTKKSQTLETQKMWICLFTCMTTRAIHLEIAEDLSASQFMMCLRRFIARRGKPIQIISDNATQFKLSNNISQRLWGGIVQDPDVTSYISSKSIEWQFITEAAPWMGGFYERLIGLVKSSLKKSVLKQRLTLVQLHTIAVEVEAVINSRPLVSKGETPEEFRYISPSCFLCLQLNNGVPILDSEESKDPSYRTSKDTASSLLDSWKKGHRILDQFWTLWNNEYLAFLRERSSFRHKQQRVLFNFLPSVDDVVLIGDNNLPRGSWKLARILQLIPSSDNIVRAAQVKLPSGSITNRPLKLLYPLECSHLLKPHGVSTSTSLEITSLQTTSSQNTNLNKESSLTTKRSSLPKRTAAINSALSSKRLAESGQI